MGRNENWFISGLRVGFGLAILLFAVTVSSCDSGQDSFAPPASDYVAEMPGISMGEYGARRRAALEAFSDGILVLHARPAEKAMEQWGFVQDATFQYFSGMTEVPGAILALDGLDGTSHLFLPSAPESFGRVVEGLVPEPDPETASRYGVASARPWTDFVDWLDGRVKSGATLYLDGARRPEATGAPNDLPPLAGDRTLWKAAIQQTFASARIQSAKAEIMAMKSVKSEAEVAILDRNARMTVVSLLAVADRLRPGVRQRETEAAMVATCLDVGGQGPSFWPWTMSGRNAHVGRLVGAFYRYNQGDRIAQAGELVRVDIGCAGGGYGADVGRTLPVSGVFSPGQAEAWNLLIAGYQAGLDAMSDGTPIAAVRAASIEAVRKLQNNMATAEGGAAAEAILSGGAGGGATLPIGTAIFQFRDALGNLVSEVGVGAILPTTRARIFVDTIDTRTGVAIASPGNAATAVRFRLLDRNGLGFAETASDLPAAGHLPIFADELFQDLPPGFTGVLEIESDVLIVPITLKLTVNGRGDLILTTLPVADLTAPIDADLLVLPQVGVGLGFSTRLILISLSDPGGGTRQGGHLG